jgi:hypothetical protein
MAASVAWKLGGNVQAGHGVREMGLYRKQLSPFMIFMGLGLKPQNVQSAFLEQASQHASQPATMLDMSAREVLYV